MNIIFENKGEIDPLLMTTFGVNVKESDNPIGFFGTGLKYGLAILMRADCGVTVQAGEKSCTFGKKAVELRGKKFEFVTMNGEPLGFTTELGKKWDLWMAYREVYCNTQDEGGRVYEADSIPEPKSGVTRVIVSGDAFVSIARDHGRYFLTSDPIVKGEYGGTLELHSERRGTMSNKTFLVLISTVLTLGISTAIVLKELMLRGYL